MNVQAVIAHDAPLPIGPYSQAVWCGDLLFVSGQLPLDPKTDIVVGATIEEQAERAVGNLLAIMASQGLGSGSLVKTTVFLRDIAHFPAFNAVYEAALGGSVRPARSVVAAAALPKNVLIEIEAVACR